MDIVARDGSAVIQVPGSGPAGYEWMLGELPAAVRLIDDHYGPGPDDAVVAVGAGGLHTFVFSVSETGRFTVRFSLRRPWEQEAIEEREFTVVS